MRRLGRERGDAPGAAEHLGKLIRLVVATLGQAGGVEWNSDQAIGEASQPGMALRQELAEWLGDPAITTVFQLVNRRT